MSALSGIRPVFARRVIGVDLGGTKVACAALDCGRGFDAEVQRTEKLSGAALLDQIATLVRTVRERDLGDGPLDAVGLGIPSIIEFATGRVVSSVNVPLRDVPLRAELHRRLGVPVFVDNDATVAAYAEAHDERLALSARNLVMLTIGTGVGGGIVIGGRIYRGSTGGAGEVGHTIIALGDRDGAVPQAAASAFPQAGSLEQLGSGGALDRLAAGVARDCPDSALGRRAAAGLPVLGPEAVAAALAGDPEAVRIVSLWAQRIGIGVANAINVFDPDEVVLGGGGAQAGSLLLAPAERIARGYILPGLGASTTIRLARHGVRAGVLGAALLAVHELEEASR